MQHAHVNVFRRALGSKLLFMTSLPAIDGTLFALGARGALSSPAAAILAGLTIIAGASAWLASRSEFDPARTSATDKLAFAVIALVSTVASVASAGLGAALGGRVTLIVFPAAAGVALLLFATEIAGFKLPKPRGLPFPSLVVVGGALAEVALWTF